MSRRCAMRLVTRAIAVAALAAPACDRVVDLTPQQDARVLNDGEPQPDTGPFPDTQPPPDALEVDAFVVAPDAGVDGGVDGAIDGAAVMAQPR